jgi:phage-related protein
MIYNENEEYKIKYFADRKTGFSPVKEYINRSPDKDRAKMFKYIEYLRQNRGVLDEPYSKHIRGKIRELRVDFGRNRHRIFFFTFVGRNIILLHAFLKNTSQTPEAEIIKANNNINQVINNLEFYVE